MNYVSGKEAGRGNQSCYRCGRQNHQPAQCPFKEAKCHKCGKYGHIQQQSGKKFAAQKKGGKGHYQQGEKGRGQPVRNVRCQSPENSDTDGDYALNHIAAVNQVDSRANRPYLVDLKLDDKPLKMEVDTGASVSIVSKGTFEHMQLRKALQPTSVRLSMYSGEPIAVLGEVDMVVTYNAQRATLPLIVVEKAGPSLLGRNWLSTIHLDWKSIGTVSEVSALSKLLENYSEVFKGGLGKLKPKSMWTPVFKARTLFEEYGRRRT